MSVSLKNSNGIGGIYEYTITAADQTATEVTFDFNSQFSLVGTFQLKSSAGAVVTPVGGIVTYPAAGQIKIANGGSVTLTAGQILVISVGINCTAL
jgi:hypothetical protein